MRALKEKYNPEDAVSWTATARELAKATGLNEAQYYLELCEGYEKTIKQIGDELK